jgi:hypothetical protein
VDAFPPMQEFLSQYRSKVLHPLALICSPPQCGLVWSGPGRICTSMENLHSSSGLDTELNARLLAG